MINVTQDEIIELCPDLIVVEPYRVQSYCPISSGLPMQCAIHDRNGLPLECRYVSRSVYDKKIRFDLFIKPPKSCMG
ncbi:MAG: hypothetical protein V1900_03135 [Candidatus Aenigmatarchaeota archaeon]